MLKSYNPELDSGKHHVVEATYMVSDAKIIVRLPVGKEHVGLEALQNSGVLGSDWVCDLDDFGEFIDIKLEGIKRLSYNDDLDSLDVFLDNGAIIDIAGDYISDYLVKVEIVEVKEGAVLL